MIEYRPEDISDLSAIDDMHRKAFGPNEPIPELIRDLRSQSGYYPTLSLVATNENSKVIGHVMVSHTWLDAPASMIDVMVLSPLGVDPEFQNQGVGSELLKRAIAASDQLQTPLLFLEGNPKFYGPRGFNAAGSINIRRPSLRIPPAAFQVIQFDSYTTEMTGTLVYREVFWRHDCVGLR